MGDVEKIKKILERKAREVEANKELSSDRIKEGFRIAKEKLERAENELLQKLESFFDPNIYLEYIDKLESDDPALIEEANSVAIIPVPSNFGPDEKAFGKLYEEINRLADRACVCVVKPPPPPRDFNVSGVGKNGFHSGVSLSWSAVVPKEEVFVERVKYKVQMSNESKAVREYVTAKTSCVFQNLKPGSMYIFSVRCMWDDKAGPWCDSIEFVTSSIPTPRNVKCTEVKDSEVTIAWDPAPVDVTWEVEMRRNKSSSEFRKKYEGSLPTCTIKELDCDTEYAFHIRSILRDGKCGEWGDEVKFKTNKWNCSWKHCPANVDNTKKYTVSGKDGKNDNVATKNKDICYYAIVIGNNPIPLGTTVSWEAILNYGNQDGSRYFFVGIAPADIDQNSQDIDYRSVYIDTSNYSIYSRYGGLGGFFSDMYSKMSGNQNFPELSKIRVIFDTQKGELSFVNGYVNLGTVRQISLDEPLVPFVVIGNRGKSAELVI